MKKKGCIILFLVLVSFMFILLLSSCTDKQFDASSFDYVIEDNHAIITRYMGESASVVVSSTIDGYSVYALEATFEGNKFIEEIVIEDGVCLIGYSTFANCTNLKKVTIPSTIQSLGSYAFENAGIESIILPENVTYVGYSCFRGCESLKYIKAEAPEITLDEYSVYNTGIKYMQLKKEPRYYGNTFSEDCPFAFSSFSAFIIRIKPLYAFTKLVQPLPAPLKAAALILTLFIVIGLILVIIFLIRFLMIKLGKDKATIYRQYSDDFLNSMKKTDEKSVTIIYMRPKFFRDNLKYIRAILYIYLFFVVFWLVSDQLLKSQNVLLRTFLSLFLMLGLIILIFVAKRLVQGIKNKYYEKKNRLPKSTIRIRRLGRGHRHDQ